MKPAVLHNQNGLALMELLVYLGLSVMMLSGASYFMVSITPVNRAVDAREHVSRDLRNITNHLAYTIKNSHTVTIPAAHELVLKTKKIGEPNDVYTRYFLSDQILRAGEAIGGAPSDASLEPLHDASVAITGLTFEQISSSVRISLTAVSHNETHTITTTVSPRQ